MRSTNLKPAFRACAHTHTHTHMHKHTNTQTHTCTNTQTHISEAFLETGNKNIHLIALHQFWKRRCQPTSYVENIGNTVLHVFLVSEVQMEHLRKSWKVLNLQMLCMTKLKALIKSYSNPFVSLRVPTAWKFDCILT